MLWSVQTYKGLPNPGEVLLGRTLPSLLEEACDRHPNSQALNEWTKKGWQALSNQELQKAAWEVALSLVDLALEKGDRVALLMHSDVHFCIADMGCLLAGLVDVPIDLTQTLENIIFILQHSQAKALIVSDLNLFSQVAPYLHSTPHLKIAIVADTDGQQSQHSPQPQWSELPPAIQVFSLLEIRAKGQALLSQSKQQQLRSQLAASDLATIIYIPGATGKPQGVMLTHENLSGNALAMFSGIPDLEFGAKEVALSYLPLTHVFARVFLYGHICYGHSIYLTTPHQVIKHLEQVQPTIFATVPLLLERIYNKILEQAARATKPITQTKAKHNLLLRIRCELATQIPRLRNSKMQRFRLSSLHWKFSPLQFSVSASRWGEIAFRKRIYNWALNLAKRYEIGNPPRGRYALMLKLADKLVFWQWRSVFGGRLKYLICGGAALKAEIANLFAAAGIRIWQGYGLTETSSAVTCNRGQFNRSGTVGIPIAGVEVAIAPDGEILTRSPYITPGYYKNPEATQQLIDKDGWLHTGDLGEFTADGFLKITGLKKSRFKLSTGKYVTPQPIESKLEQSPLVAKAVAVGAERKFCAMLIFPNLDRLHSYASTIGINLPTQELLKHPCIIATYQALVDQANCHLPHWSTVKRFQLVNATLTVENDMLTPDRQLKRANILKAFAKEIDAMYADAGTQKHEITHTGKVEEQHNPLSSCCPYIPQADCPAFAQSLNI